MMRFIKKIFSIEKNYTLEELASGNYNRQSVFDTVVDRIVKQNRIAVDPATGSCYYNSPQYGKCAIGVLLSEKESRYLQKKITQKAIQIVV